jgi:aldehyde:ferredoxin oxidoreductase
MDLKGVIGRIAWVDLGTGEVVMEEPDNDIYSNYLGGYGLGAYYLYTRQKAGVDPLGPENILGLVAGPLTGTQAITGNRFAVVGKSPKTGGWGDANCGGRFGPALKQAGLDAIFFRGISQKPSYVLIEKDRITIHDALAYRGLNCPDTEDKFKEEYGKKAHAVVIGPAGERVSALAAIINDKGRAAGRSGLGMVMGAKGLKGVVAMATDDVPVAEDERLKELRQRVLAEFYNKENPPYDFFNTYGTPGVLEGAVISGDAPIMNWGGWADNFNGYDRINGDAVIKLQSRNYGCWNCPIACGGYVKVPSGPYAGEGHKPEYETLGAFGTMCLNNDLDSICRLNNICNDAGMDTISTGATVAFAMECFERGLINEKDTGGLELKWGNHEAIVRITEQMAKGEGFGGEILGQGIKKAVEKLGPESAPYAMECGGEELPMHDPRCNPGFGISYVADATPGRHTQGGAASIEGGLISHDLEIPKIQDKYKYSGKGYSHKYASSFFHIINAAGLCNFSSILTPGKVVPEFLSLAMGRSFTLEDLLHIGERITNLRIAFNLREDIRNKEQYRLPSRVLGNPPLNEGPIKKVTIDNEAQLRDYYKAMGWNPDTGVPKISTFKSLELDFALGVAEP